MTILTEALARLAARMALSGALAVLGCAAAGSALASCRPDDFAAAVDRSGAALRALNAEMKPKLERKLEQLGRSKGWAKSVREERGYAYLADERIAAFDAEANELLGKVDDLGSLKGGSNPDCARLIELEQAGGKLLAVMKAKSRYTLDKIDAELGAGRQAAKPRETPAAPPATPVAPKPESAPANEAAPPVAAGPAPGIILPSDAFVPDEQGYTIDEIREASRGLFGTLSTELGSVIEHAFAKTGRPTAYILGSEGGGAFLAGLRYGSGTLYLREGGTRKVYWHGPSIGGDIGAEGARTLYLIYRLKNPDDLFRRFAGIDGSAYLVGGVGITFLKGGEVIMAPIRSGLGLRLGASIGYVRFTPQATWNPF